MDNNDDLQTQSEAQSSLQPVSDSTPPTWRTDIEKQPGYSADSIPPWHEVEASDSFKNASPENRLVAFDRWHNLAYNLAKQAPNWNEAKNDFNQQAYDTQQRLSADAGGLDPHMARLKLANDATAQEQDPAKKAAIVAGLGQDVESDWKQPPTFSQQLLRPLSSFGNAVARGLGESLKGLGYVGETAYNAMAGGDAHSFIGQLGKNLTDRADALDGQLDPRTKGGISDVVGSTAGGLLEFLGESAVGAEALKLGSAARVAKFGPEAAQSVKQLAGKLAAMGVFGLHNGEQGMEQAQKAGVGQDKVLETFLADAAVGAGTAILTPAQKWLQRFDEATGGSFTNTAKKALTEGGQFALQMFAQQLGNNVVAKTALAQDVDLLQDTFNAAKSGGVTGMVASTALSILAHGRPAIGLKGAAEPTVDNLKQSGAPATAEAVQKAGAAPPAEPGVGPGPSFNFDEAGNPTLQVAPEHTTEQLQATRTGVEANTDLTPEEKTSALAQIDAEIKSRTVPPEGAAPPAGEAGILTEKEKQQQQATARIEEAKHNAGMLRDQADIEREQGSPETADRLEAQAAEIEKTLPDRISTPAHTATISEAATPEEEKAAENIHGAVERAVAKGETPSMREIKRVGYVAPSAEEKATRATEGRQALHSKLDETGITPDRSEIADAIGGAPSSKPVTEMLAELQAKAAEKYPPETIPAGAKENPPLEAPEEAVKGRRGEIKDREAEIKDHIQQVRFTTEEGVTPEQKRETIADLKSELGKLHFEERGVTEAAVPPDVHPVTREHLPTVTEADGTVRPKFTNDPRVTAQQLDASQFDTSAKRMYLPDELVDEDKINPSIKFAYDKAAGKYYVTGVDMELPYADEPKQVVKGTVKGPGDFTDLYNQSREGANASNEIGVGGTEELEGIAGKGAKKETGAPEDEEGWKELAASQGLDWDEWKTDDTEDREEQQSLPAMAKGLERLNQVKAQMAEESNRAKKNIAEVSALVPNPDGDRLGQALSNAATSKDIPEYQRRVAELILKALGGSTKDIDLTLSVDPKYAGKRGVFDTASDGTDQRIVLNPAEQHETGMIGTILHEAFHAATVLKSDPKFRYKLNPFESHALKQLNILFEKAQKDLLTKFFGKDPTPKDIAAFKGGHVNLDVDHPITQAAIKNPDLYFAIRNGVLNLHEFIAEGSNPNFVAELAKLDNDPNVKSGLGQKIKGFLDALRHWVGNLVAGEPLKQGSLAEQALTHIQTLVEEGFDKNKLWTQSQAEAELSRFPAQATDKMLFSLARKGMLTPEYAKSVMSKSTPVTQETLEDAMKKGEPEKVDLKVAPGMILKGGWLTPKGEFAPLMGDDAHDETILRHLRAENPTLFNKVGGVKDSLFIDNNDFEMLHDRVTDAGYIRVTPYDEDGVVYFEGNPTQSQRRILRDAAADQGLRLSSARPRNEIFRYAAESADLPKLNEASEEGRRKLEKELFALPPEQKQTVMDLQKQAQGVVEDARSKGRQIGVPLEKVDREAIARSDRISNVWSKQGATLDDEIAKYKSIIKEGTDNAPTIGAAEDRGTEDAMNVGEKPTRISHAAQAAGPVTSPTPKVHLDRSIDSEGKLRNTLRWDPDATRGDLLAYQDTITKSKLPDSEKQRLNQQLATALGPTVSIRDAKDETQYGYDRSGNIANNIARNARKAVIVDMFGKDETKFGKFGGNLTDDEKMDLKAARHVFEAGTKEEMQRQVDLVKNADPTKLSDKEKEKWLPTLQYALDNYDRLSGMKGKYQEIMADQLQQERANGIATGELEDYVTHLLQYVEDKNFFMKLVDKVTGAGSGTGTGGNYFIKGRNFKTFADALAEGFAPKEDANIADLTQRRVEVGQRLLQMKKLQNELSATKLPDGRTIIAPMQEYENYLGEGGYRRVPKGYETVLTGAKPIVVAKELAPLFNALNSRSAFDSNTFLRWLKMGTAGMKRNVLVFDSYHVGRILFKELAYGGANRIGWNRGLALLDYDPATLSKLVENGEVPQRYADWANANRDKAQKLIDAGLNVGKVMDNLVAQHAAAVPVLKNFNPWVFQKLSRGAMLQTALDNFDRNMRRFPERGEEGNARQTAKEMNEVFGNLQNQSIFKIKTFQDLTRVASLSPQWAESQLAAEARGIGQLAKAPLDLLRGNARLGTVAQGQLTVILGMLAAAQVANYLTTGHSTFENRKEHMLDAYVPSGQPGKGFWFSPLEIGGEYSMMAMRYFGQHMMPIDVLSRIAQNKLSPLGRSTTELLTGRDYAGRAFGSTGDRLRGAMEDLIPAPIGVSAAFERDPRSNLGFRLTRQPGSFEKQALQSLGVKLAPEMTPRSETFAMAYPFREDGSYSDRASDYRELRRALDNDQLDAAETEVRGLLNRGKTWDQIRASAGISKGGSIKPERFTGGTTTREHEFVKSLTADQKEIYEQAQRDHIENAKKLRVLLTRLRPELRAQFLANERAHQGYKVAE